MELEGTVNLTLASYEALKVAGKDAAGQINAKDIEVRNILRKLEFTEAAFSAWTRFLMDPKKELDEEKYIETLVKVVDRFNQKGLVAQLAVAEESGKLAVEKKTMESIQTNE